MGRQRDRAVRLVFAVARRLVPHLPRAVRALLVRVGAWLLMRSGASGVQVLRANLQGVPGTTEATVREGVRRYLAYVLDHLELSTRSTAGIVADVDVVGFEQAMEEAGGGAVVFVGSHSGNWDHVVVTLAHRLGGLDALASGDARVVTDSLVATYAKHGVALLRGTVGVIRVARERLSAGRSLLVLCDFAPPGARVVEVPVLGHSLAMPSTAFDLALTAGVPLFPFSARYTDSWRLEIRIGRPIAAPASADHDERVRALAEVVGARFGEDWTEAPEDWHAYHQPAWG